MSLTQINKAGLDEIALDHVFTIGASGSSAYTFQGEGLNGTVNNPTLYLTRGKTYRFENGSGGHPIRIQSTSGASGTAYNTGVTNNAGSGTVIVEVQHDAPDILYYQCTSHAAMNGILYVTGALADNSVTSAKIAAGAVTNSKIGNAQVTGAKLSTNSVGNGMIVAAAVSTDKIANSAVTTAKIADDAVTDAKLANSINSAIAANTAKASITINNNADNRLITGSGTANTLNGESSFTFNGTKLNLNTAGSSSHVVEFINSSSLSTEGTVLKLRASGRGAGVDDTDVFLTTGNADTRVFSVTNAGTLHTTGNIKIASGKGIDFSANSNASGMTSELLDDYEEGTWTPVVKPNASSSAFTYGSSDDYEFRSAAASGITDSVTYTKIGNRVFISFSIYMNTSGTSRLNISLPFAIKGNDYQVAGHIGYYKIAGSAGAGFLGQGLNSIDIFELDGDGNHPNLSYATNSELYINLQYETN